MRFSFMILIMLLTMFAMFFVSSQADYYAPLDVYEGYLYNATQKALMAARAVGKWDDAIGRMEAREAYAAKTAIGGGS